jgi:hypothetical protein
LTLNQVQVTPVEQGTSGNLIIDIKVGDSPGTATTSVFSTLPTLAWDDTLPATGIINSNLAEIAAGQFVVVSIESVQEKLSRFHLYIGGDV